MPEKGIKYLRIYWDTAGNRPYFALFAKKISTMKKKSRLRVKQWLQKNPVDCVNSSLRNLLKQYITFHPTENSIADFGDLVSDIIGVMELLDVLDRQVNKPNKAKRQQSYAIAPEQV